MAKLLFCEDDALIRRMIGVMLRGSGHDIVLAADGEEGLALIEREHPAVVFTDRWMPGLDGLALCDAIKARPDLADIPVILITGGMQDADQAEALRRGAATVLQKPFSPAQLRDLVARYA